MNTIRSTDWTAHSVRIAACGLGAVLGGPLGGVLGGWLGNALGPSAVDLITHYAEKFGEGAAVKLLDLGAGSFVQGSEMEMGPTELEALYRETLQFSLNELSTSISGNRYEDWFNHWQCCLASKANLNLSDVTLGQSDKGNPHDQLRLVLETLDAQGAAMARNDLSLNITLRALPEELLSKLIAKLPESLDKNFRALIVGSKYERAWKEKLLIFERSARKALEDIDQTTQRTESKVDRIGEDAKAIRELLEKEWRSAQQQGRLSPEQLKDKDQEIARLTEQLRKLQDELAARSSEPEEVRLSTLIATGDLAGAIRLKSNQVNSRRSEAQMLPRDLFELGKLHELRFDWPNALRAYREAWELRQDPEFGFSYAYYARLQNHFTEAIAVYQNLLPTSRNPADRAMTLNNMAVLYRETQRMKDAEAAFVEALSIRHELAKANPEAYLPIVAMTLNNMAILYRDTQRMKDAEAAYGEALSKYRELAKANPEAYLPDVAMTLNNLAILYSDTQRMKGAEAAFGEALSKYRELAKANPEAYLPYVAMTLNNLANLYRDAQRMKDAEAAFGEALSNRRELAKANPEAYLPDVATTLNNLAVLYSDAQRMKDAEAAYGEALSIRRELAKANPEAYLPYVATTLNNLAVLYSDAQRMKDAEAAYGEALSIRHELAKANPEAYLPDVATTLNNLAVLYRETQRMKDAEAAFVEALSIRHELAKANPEAYLPDVATTLNNLAVLYSDTQRMKDAEGAYGEALSKYRELAKANPEAYLRYVAMTLNNLAVLYSDTQRMKDAEGAYGEALSKYRGVGQSEPGGLPPGCSHDAQRLGESLPRRAADEGRRELLLGGERYS